MTKPERRNPKILDAKRKKRIAAGSGTSVQDINRLVKMHRQMADMMKAMGKKRGIFSQMFGSGPPESAGRAAPGADTAPRWLATAAAGRLSGFGRRVAAWDPWPARRTPRPSRPAGFQETMRST